MKKLIAYLALTALLTLSSQAKDVYATFNVKANKEAILAFTASGRIAKCFVEVGSRVKKGDILASLENSEEKIDLALAKEDLYSAQIEAKQSLNSYNRYKKVKEILEEEKFEKIAFAKELSQNAASKAAYRVELRQAQLEKRDLKAPFDGVVTRKMKELGDSVTGMQVMPVFELMDIEHSKLILEFDARYWSEVREGQIFSYKIDGRDENFTGSITKVYPTIDSSNRKIKAELIVKYLKPGLFGQGSIKVD